MKLYNYIRLEKTVVFLVLIIIISGLFSRSIDAKVVEVKIESRETILNGKKFENYGPYELIKGTIKFGFDPANPSNKNITDLLFAPRNNEGLVEAVANFVILKPIDMSNSSNTALVEVSNRGGKFSLSYFNRAAARVFDANNKDSFGDALLMKQGLVLIWIGWQFDVPDKDELLRLEVPIAANIDGSFISGLVRGDWTMDETTYTLALSHRGHKPYSAYQSEANVLTVRDGREAARKVIPKTEWSFARYEDGVVIPDSNFIYLKSGFQEGKIYEFVYQSKNPSVVGLGLGVIRDIISYVKYDANAILNVKYGVAAGVSQTGRFLRHYIYQDFNTDEWGRKCYDGLLIITAGAGRGSFNHRFGQPSRDGHRYSSFFYPTDIFPFTSKTQFDSVQFSSDGLFAHTTFENHLPKIFYINTGYEYWGRSASLIHTSVNGSNDITPFDNERIYHIASGQHYVGQIPKVKYNANIYRSNPLEFKINYRALLLRLIEWVNKDKTPPASLYPKLSEGNLILPEEIKYPVIPGLKIAVKPNTAYRVDYGPQWAKGIIEFEPPKLGVPYISRVSSVDEFGNEAAGIRNVEVSVPLATYLPWNLREDFKGGRDEIIDFQGTFIPLPKTESQKKSAGDSRKSIESLYKSKEDYLSKVKEQINILIVSGFLLPDDDSYVLERASMYWDWITSN